MIRRSMWKNDEFVYDVEDFVLLRINTDANKRTRKLPLNDHLYNPPLKIHAIRGELYDLIHDNGILEKNIHKSRIKPVFK